MRQFSKVREQPSEEAKEQVLKLGSIAAGSRGFLNALALVRDLVDIDIRVLAAKSISDVPPA